LYAAPLVASGTLEVVIINFAGAGALAVTATVALAFAVGSAALVAVTVTFRSLDTVGAVNIPVAEIVPALADQITPGLFVLCVAAVN
jgi:hypothetical protein